MRHFSIFTARNENNKRTQKKKQNKTRAPLIRYLTNEECRKTSTAQP